MKKDNLRAIRLGFLGGMGFVLGLAVTGLLASELINGLWNFKANDVLSATEINHNFDTLNARITAAGSVPVGTILAWHKSFASTPSLPVGYQECNGQLLNDTTSVYHNQTLPNLNGAPNAWNTGGSFLRGGSTSGTIQTDSYQGHHHRVYGGGGADSGNGANTVAHNVGPQPPNGTTAHYFGAIASFAPGNGTIGWSGTQENDGTNGAPRSGMENRPANMSVVWIIKVK